MAIKKLRSISRFTEAATTWAVIDGLLDSDERSQELSEVETKLIPPELDGGRRDGHDWRLSYISKP